MTKAEYRKKYLNKRAQIPENQRLEFSRRIFEHLKNMPLNELNYYHIFVPIENHHEINTWPIIHDLFKNGKKVIVPKTQGNQMLNCGIGPDTKFESGNFNVPEPVEYQTVPTELIEVVLIPMLICDRKGNRIGYGGGFYDRFLAHLKKGSLKIGLNFFAPIEEIIETEPTDVPLDYCITPEEIVSFVS
ncbi:MAG: 5-formyltetrahydrofolate cyclo-ligase [Weeksellaceae bacterium]|jgi:5-formyltetrahydrofolate cyclo-ligase|nr:5-formyltetrahydrofolate cyclo-ligase [Weeksellaceae bacterium]